MLADGDHIWSLLKFTCIILDFNHLLISLVCYRCKWLQLPGNHLHITHHRTIHMPISSFHRHFFHVSTRLQVCESRRHDRVYWMTHDLQCIAFFYIALCGEIGSHIMRTRTEQYGSNSFLKFAALTVQLSNCLDPYMAVAITILYR